ncbi:MAG TPA: CPBP family intramembrane metalloprotease, partial [Aestuariivirga sp.]|nr:CPBP family intramembrane metalloprotease [Aestuariivirga sp.]
MNAGTTPGISSEEKGAAWRAILIFLILTMAFSAVFDGIMIHQGVSSLLMVTGVMWSPGMAAIVTCLILKRPIASLPWRWGGWKLSWFAYLLPLAYALAMYLPVWLGHLGGSGFGPPDALREFAGLVTGNLPEGAAAPAGAVAAGVLITGTVGIIDKASRALGEEIGWRGFLVWEMRKVMPFWAVGLLSGFIWSLWHWPGILFTDYNAGEGNLVV